MDWSRLAQASGIPEYAACILMLAVAGAVLAVNFHGRPNRAFAVFLVLRALALPLFSAADLAKDSPDAVFYIHLVYYVGLPLPFALAYFLSVYPRPRGWFGTTRLGGWLLLAGGVGIDALYAANHELFVHVSSAAQNGAWDQVTWLTSLNVALYFATFAAAVAIFARDFLQETHPSRRRALLAITLAFAVHVAYDGWRALATPPWTLFRGPNASWDLLVWAAQVAGLAVVAATGAAIVAAGRRAHAPGPRVWLAFGLAVALPGLGFLLLRLAPGAGWPPFLNIGMARLGMAALIAYALVRHQLFGIDFAIKRTLVASILGFTLLASIVVASQVAQGVFSERFGWLGGGVAAGVFVLALQPLHAVSRRIGDAAMPRTKALALHSRDERLAVYREQVELAWSDGRMTANEVQILRSLQHRLGVDAVSASRIQSAVVAALPAPLPVAAGHAGAPPTRP